MLRVVILIVGRGINRDSSIAWFETTETDTYYATNNCVPPFESKSGKRKKRYGVGAARHVVLCRCCIVLRRYDNRNLANLITGMATENLATLLLL
jgi:hypothetical protein